MPALTCLPALHACMQACLPACNASSPLLWMFWIQVASGLLSQAICCTRSEGTHPISITRFRSGAQPLENLSARGHHTRGSTQNEGAGVPGRNLVIPNSVIRSWRRRGASNPIGLPSRVATMHILVGQTNMAQVLTFKNRFQTLGL